MHHRKSLFLPIMILAILLATSVFATTGCGKEAEEKEIALKEPSMTPVEDIPDDKKFTFDDVLYGEYISEMAFSPDGSLLAWCKDFCAPGMETRADNIFLTDLAADTTTQLTSFEGAIIFRLKWSQDGTRLAFLSDAAPSGAGDAELGAIQVLSVAPEGGEVVPMTSVDGGVEEYGWKDAQSVLYTAAVAQDEEVEPGDDTIHVSEYCESPVRLFQLDLAGGEITQVTGNDDRVINLAVSPDGRYAFYERTRSKMYVPGQTYSGDIPFNNYLLELSSGDERQVFEEMRSTAGAVWSPDSKTLYAVDLYYEDPNPFAFRAEALALDISSGEESSIDLDWPRGMEMMGPFGLPNTPMRPTPDGFIAILADGCNPKVARYVESGGEWEQVMLEGEHQGNIFYIEVSPDGETVCYDHSDASKPPQIYAASLQGSEITGPRAITALNPGFDDRIFAPSETIIWEGARDNPVEGVLFYPEGYEPGNRYPLMLVIHGGPFECDKDRWQTYQWIDPYHILSQKGAFVLAPNYHGSLGYGENSIDFAASIQNGEFYGLVTEDIEKGMDWLIELGMVDGDRMGTMGWSCGSIISNALIVRDQRFKVASCGAGGGEWVSEWGGAMFGDVLVPSLFGSDPIENPDLFKDPAQAPFYDAARVQTPVIMFQPGEDVHVTPDMTWITYRGIQKYSDAPVELYIFPGEDHVPMLIPHQRRKMEEEQRWFDRYFFE